MKSYAIIDRDDCQHIATIRTNITRKRMDELERIATKKYNMKNSDAKGSIFFRLCAEEDPIFCLTNTEVFLI